MKHVFPSLLILLLFSCKKDQYDNASGEKNISLPAYTETGKGSFAFLMDTTIFTIYGAHRETSALFPATWVKNTAITGYNISASTHQPAFTAGGKLSVVRQNTIIKQYEAILSFTPDLASPLKTYKLSGFLQSPFSGSFYVQKQFENGGYSGVFLIANDNNPVILELLKFDTVNRICSGRFSGILHDAYGSLSDSVSIKDGRFDVRIPK